MRLVESFPEQLPNFSKVPWASSYGHYIARKEFWCQCHILRFLFFCSCIFDTSSVPYRHYFVALLMPAAPSGTRQHPRYFFGPRQLLVVAVCLKPKARRHISKRLKHQAADPTKVEGLAEDNRKWSLGEDSVKT